ncbi:chalcone isomerase family protein [Verminephrobacter eiseniae]|nr:chalcone isomerase family protein [Verminephrobacter eiseniae]MCW5231604.1 hypothetical protein [Verminephrobacter eiseniae]MCW5293334.1 hypothetical protein [Verminephrobacter eiseniae]MCW8186793.1 hypothetical protein [Verminephrobacter eiseniae]MCW8225155.1 hypothetical protein [Verminephrobacter eiseniae]MCW8236101.1 hypothetical protein [Verminephrobacter eiseniae]
MIEIKRRTVLISIGLLFTVNPILASEVIFDGIRFEKFRKVDGTILKCNGIGKRTILFFDAYHAVLYTEIHYDDFDTLRQSNQPRILELRLLRDAPLSQLEKVVVDGIRKNSNADQLTSLHERLQALLANMRRVKFLTKGDILEIIFSNDSTQLRINKVDLGNPILGKDFNDAFLSIWLGPHPIDSELKRQLLDIK